MAENKSPQEKLKAEILKLAPLQRKNTDDVIEALEAYKEGRDVLQEISANTKDQRDAAAGILAVEQERLRNLDETAEAQLKLLTRLNLTVEARLKEAEIQAKTVDSLHDELAGLDERLGYAKDEATQAKELEDTRKRMFDKIKGMSDQQKEALKEKFIEAKTLEDKRTVLDDIYKQEDKISGLITAQAEGTAQFEDKLHSSLGEIGLMGEKWKTGIVGGMMASIVAQGKLVKEGRDTRGVFTGIWGVIKNAANEMFTMDNLLNASMNAAKSLASAMWKMAMAMDTAMAAFSKATGAGRGMSGAFGDATKSAEKFGMVAADVAATMAPLFTGFMNFSSLTRTAKAETMALAAGMSGIGVDAGSFASGMDVATKALGMTHGAGMELQKDLARTAMSLGLPPGVISKEFGPAMKTLAAFGQQGVKVFQGLAAQSKASGISIQGLLGIASKFDTFSDAAQHVGRLNSILGGDYMNSIQMLNANESERIDLLRQGFKDSGRQYSDLSRFEKKALASAAGITDMTEAARLFGGQQDVWDTLKTRADKAGISVQEMEKRMKDSKDMGAKWAAILQQLSMVMLPLVNFVHFVLNGLIDLGRSIDSVLGPGKGLIVVMGGIALGLIAIFAPAYLVHAIVIGLILVFAKLFHYLAVKKSSPVFYILLGVIAAALIGLAMAAYFAAPSLSILAWNVLFLGKGILMAAGGLAIFIASLALLAFVMSKMTPEQMAGFIIAVISSIAALAVAAFYAAGPIGFLGLGMLALGFGVALLVGSLALLGFLMMKFPGMFEMAAVALFNFIMTFAMLAIQVAPALPFMIILAGVLVILGIALIFAGAGMLLFGTGVMLAGVGVALVVASIALLAKIISSIGGTVTPLVGVILAMGGAMALAAPGAAALAIAMTPLVAALAVGVGPILAFGLAMLMVGAGFLLAGYGVKLVLEGLTLLVAAIIPLASSLLNMAGAMLASAPAMIVLAGAVAILAVALWFGIGPLIAFGYAMMMIGTGFAMASAGATILLTALAAMLPMVQTLGGPLMSMSIAILTLSVALMALIGVMTLIGAIMMSGFGFLAMAITIGAISLAIETLASAINTIKAPSAESFAKFLGELNKLTPAKSIALKATMEGFSMKGVQDTFEAIGKIEPAKAEAGAKILKQFQETLLRVRHEKAAGAENAKKSYELKITYDPKKDTENIKNTFEKMLDDTLKTYSHN